MNCPLCIDQTLDVSHHGGIEVDLCPRCRGVWLDRGELERLAQRTARDAESSPSVPQTWAPTPATEPPGQKHRDRDRDRDRVRDRDDRDRDRDRSDRSRSNKRKKQKSKRSRFADAIGEVLEEVLDFD